MKFFLPKKEPLDLFEWHDMFAWLPVHTIGGYIVWLETVQRRWATRSSSDFSATREYRLKEAP